MPEAAPKSLRSSSLDNTIAPSSAAIADAIVVFPLPGAPPTSTSLHLALPKMLERQIVMHTRDHVVGRRGSPLSVPQGGNLGADVGPVGHVVVSERGRMMLVGELAVPAQQFGGCTRSGQPMKIHREEADVGKHIADSQSVVESQAVENAWTVVEAEDVVGQQIAVSVPHEPPVDPAIEEVGLRRQVPASPIGDFVEVGSSQDVIDDLWPDR